MFSEEGSGNMLRNLPVPKMLGAVKFSALSSIKTAIAIVLEELCDTVCRHCKLDNHAWYSASGRSYPSSFLLCNNASFSAGRDGVDRDSSPLLRGLKVAGKLRED